MKTHTTNEMEV